MPFYQHDCFNQLKKKLEQGITPLLQKHDLALTAINSVAYSQANNLTKSLIALLNYKQGDSFDNTHNRFQIFCLLQEYLLVSEHTIAEVKDLLMENLVEIAQVIRSTMDTADKKEILDCYDINEIYFEHQGKQSAWQGLLSEFIGKMVQSGLITTRKTGFKTVLHRVRGKAKSSVLELNPAIKLPINGVNQKEARQKFTDLFVIDTSEATNESTNTALAKVIDCIKAFPLNARLSILNEAPKAKEFVKYLLVLQLELLRLAIPGADASGYKTQIAMLPSKTVKDLLTVSEDRRTSGLLKRFKSNQKLTNKQLREVQYCIKCQRRINHIRMENERINMLMAETNPAAQPLSSVKVAQFCPHKCAVAICSNCFDPKIMVGHFCTVKMPTENVVLHPKGNSSYYPAKDATTRIYMLDGTSFSWSGLEQGNYGAVTPSLLGFTPTAQQLEDDKRFYDSVIAADDNEKPATVHESQYAVVSTHGKPTMVNASAVTTTADDIVYSTLDFDDAEQASAAASTAENTYGNMQRIILANGGVSWQQQEIGETKIQAVICPHHKVLSFVRTCCPKHKWKKLLYCCAKELRINNNGKLPEASAWCDICAKTATHTAVTPGKSVAASSPVAATASAPAQTVTLDSTYQEITRPGCCHFHQEDEDPTQISNSKIVAAECKKHGTKLFKCCAIADKESEPQHTATWCDQCETESYDVKATGRLQLQGFGKS